METVLTLATKNFENHIQHNPYPGRGLVIGRSTVKDAWLMIYWIMGRSEQSRNRRFVAAGTLLRTEPVDVSLVKNPSLIIYDAMLELPGIYLLSNGDQTRTLYDTIQAGGSFDDALATRMHEPDAPHYTPRISGQLTIQNEVGSVALSIIKASKIDPAFSDRFTYRPAMPEPGFGFGLTTYQGNGNPLPSFQGEPLLLPWVGSAEDVLNTYWNALNETNRIALAVKEIPAAGGPGEIFLRNRFA